MTVLTTWIKKYMTLQYNLSETSNDSLYYANTFRWLHEISIQIYISATKTSLVELNCYILMHNNKRGEILSHYNLNTLCSTSMFAKRSKNVFGWDGLLDNICIHSGSFVEKMWHWRFSYHETDIHTSTLKYLYWISIILSCQKFYSPSIWFDVRWSTFKLIVNKVSKFAKYAWLRRMKKIECLSIF